tara:strand:- start:332 stop:472 length:141 start_codon:yes stop_codon:yes gene_type:complete
VEQEILPLYHQHKELMEETVLLVQDQVVAEQVAEPLLQAQLLLVQE